MKAVQFILASRSPQRVELLLKVGYAFACVPADIDEEHYPSALTPDEVAQYLATAKARHIGLKHASSWVLAADTVVALGNKVLGKPSNAQHATEMLQSLSGSTHRVITGVALINLNKNAGWYDRVVSEVQMRKLSEQDIANYVETNQWKGKAGGYGLQDEDPFVICTTGSPTNVIGLPIERTSELLKLADILPYPE